MTKRALLCSTALVAMPGTAQADPLFTPLIIAGLASVGVTGTAATITATILSAIVVTAIGIGLTLLFAPRPPKPENGTVAVQQPIPFRIYGYGTARVPGAIVFKEEHDGYMGYIAVLNGHQIDRFVGLYLNDDLVTVHTTTDGFLSGFVSQGADGRYKNSSVSIATRHGDPTETAYPLITNRFSSIWDASCRGDECASLAMLLSPAKSKDFATIYPYAQNTAPSPIIQQYVVFDPRDVTQNLIDAGTWKFSDNCALAILHFQCFSIYGPARNYATAIAPVLSTWIQAINDCDDLMPLKAGGTEKRYRLGGYTTTEQDRRSTLQAMLAACDGWFVERGDGTIVLTVGKFRTPTVTLTDDDILGYTIQRDVASEDKINRATARYTSPDNAYVTVETTPLNDLADQAARPGPIRSSQMDLTWVQATGQASRLLKREMIRQGEKTRGTLTVRLSGINAAFERWVQVSSNSIPRLSGVVIENRKPVISLQAGTVTIDIIGSGPQIDEYTAATDESDPPPVPQRPTTVGLPIPAKVSAVAEQNGSSVFVAVSWDEPLDAQGNPYTNLSYQVEFRLSAASNGGTAGPWTPQQFSSPAVSGSRVMINTGAVPTGVTLDVQVSSVATGATLSTASDIVSVSTALLAPSKPTGFSAANGTGEVILTCTNPTSTVFASVQFYRTSPGGTFVSADPIGRPIAGARGATTTYHDPVGPGTYDYYATAASSGGTSSDPAGPATGTAS